MLAVMILILLVLVWSALWLLVAVGHLGNITGAVGHIARVWSMPVEDEERRGG